MEKNSLDLKNEIEKIFLSNGYEKKDDDFERHRIKFIYAGSDPEIGHGYFVRIADDLVETVYFPDVKFITHYLSNL